MTFRFSRDRGLIIVRAELTGPVGSIVLRLALDTGATFTLINTGALVAVGYDPSLAPDRIQVTTGSGVEYALWLPVLRLKALGHDRSTFPLLAHTLPPSASIDGLLGLDFMRERQLRIDLHRGHIRLT